MHKNKNADQNRYANFKQLLKKLRDKLPYGSYTAIQKRLKDKGVVISIETVRMVLKGEFNDKHSIIKEASEFLKDHIAKEEAKEKELIENFNQSDLQRILE